MKQLVSRMGKMSYFINKLALKVKIWIDKIGGGRIDVKQYFPYLFLRTLYDVKQKQNQVIKALQSSTFLAADMIVPDMNYIFS